MTGLVVIKTDTQEAKPEFSLRGKLLSKLVIQCAFKTDVEIVALADGATGRCTIKTTSTPAGDALLLDTAWTHNGEEGEDALYEFVWNSADSVELRAALGSEPFVILTAEIRWTVDGVSYASSFPIHFENAWSRPDDDDAPDAALTASEDWLRARCVRIDEEQDVSDDEKTQLLENLFAYDGVKLYLPGGKYIRVSS